MSHSANVGTAPRTTGRRIAAGIVGAAVLATAANALIAVLTVAAGASDAFHPLEPSAYVPLTVQGVLAGAVGWAAVRRWSRRPAAVLRVLVPAVVAVSLVPDVALLFTDMQPNTGGLGVAALMVMHVATAVIAVPLFARALPLPADR